MPTEVSFTVAEGYAFFGFNDKRFEAGVEHKISVSKDTLGLVAAANAAGVIKVSAGKLPSVESDKDSLAKQAKAEAARHKLQIEDPYGIRDVDAEEEAAQKALEG